MVRIAEESRASLVARQPPASAGAAHVRAARGAAAHEPRRERGCAPALWLAVRAAAAEVAVDSAQQHLCARGGGLRGRVDPRGAHAGG